MGDTLTNNDFTGMSLQKVWTKQMRTGILGGVTELQCEPWRDGTPKSEEPGNNLQLLFFSLLRLQRAYKFDQSSSFQTDFPVFLWGLEELLRHMTEENDPHRIEHQQIIRLVQQINAL